MIIMIKHVTTSVLMYFFLLAPLQATENIPNGLMFVGYSGGVWRVYVKDNIKEPLREIVEIQSPRNVSWNRWHHTFSYVDINANFIQINTLTKKRRRLKGLDPKDRFSQPKYSANGSRLFAVKMPGGKSRHTELVEISNDFSSVKTVVNKRTAQFEPSLNGEDFLYYTTALCIDDCPNMIWELWRKNLVTLEQEQITLLNSVSRKPVLAGNGLLYFSSNSGGNYHIWKMLPTPGAPPEQLTFGHVYDTDPAIDKDNDLYFLRRTNEGVNLMRLVAGKAVVVLLPDHVTDIRNLEIMQ